MIKVITLLKRKEGVSLDEFCRYWEETHGPLMMQKRPPLVKRYVQNHAVRLGRGEPRYDGIAETWYNDLESFRAMANFDQSELRQSLERFVDTSQMVSIITEEKFVG